MGSRRQFGSVRKLPSGRWQASYWHVGRRHVAPITFAFKADANAYLSSIETEVRGVFGSRASDPTVSGSVDGRAVAFMTCINQWRA